MKTLVLLRHGESVWNKENRFTGWTDVPLSKNGIEEARKAGRLLRKEGVPLRYCLYLNAETGDQEPGVSARFAGRAAFRKIKAAEYAPPVVRRLSGRERKKQDSFLSVRRQHL